MMLDQSRERLGQSRDRDPIEGVHSQSGLHRVSRPRRMVLREGRLQGGFISTLKEKLTATKVQLTGKDQMNWLTWYA